MLCCNVLVFSLNKNKEEKGERVLFNIIHDYTEIMPYSVTGKFSLEDDAQIGVYISLDYDGVSRRTGFDPLLGFSFIPLRRRRIQHRHQTSRVLQGCEAGNLSGLDGELVGGEVGGFEEDHLVLMRSVQGLGIIFHDAEMDYSLSNCRVVCSVVGGRDEFCASEPGLDVCC